MFNKVFFGVNTSVTLVGFLICEIIISAALLDMK